MSALKNEAGSDDIVGDWERRAEDNDSCIDDEMKTCLSVENTSDNLDPSNKHTDKITSLIMSCWQSGDIKLDLSRRNIVEIPSALLQLTTLEYLYLEGNKLTGLPADFFSSLPALKWLDLRRNKLTTLSCSSLADHKSLQTLLLEGNQLKTLPFQLGMLSSLVSLNIRGNPLEFPPPEILEKGVNRICQYLRDLSTAKSEGRYEDIDRLLLGQSLSLTEQEMVSESNCKQIDVDSFRATGSEFNKNDSNKLQQAYGLSKTVNKKTGGKPANRDGVQLNGKSTRSNALCITQSEKYLDPTREMPLTPDVIEAKAKTEHRLKKKKSENVKIEAELQRIKNKETIKRFHDETKRLQQKKLMERRINGKIDFEQPATKAPFAIETGSLRLPTNEERLAYDPREENERPRPMSPASVLRNEELRVLKEKALEAKIREHTKAMRERRLKPRGDSKQELEAARRELEFAMSLKAELEQVKYQTMHL